MIAALMMKLSKVKLKEVKSEMEKLMQIESQSEKNLKVITLVESDQQKVYLIKVSISYNDAEKITDMQKKEYRVCTKDFKRK